MLEKLIKSFANRDSAELSACFSRDCKYFDYCPACNGKQNFYLYGREGLEMFFRNRFACDQFEMGDPRVEDADTVSFFGAYYGPYIYAKMHIEAYDEAGLILKCVVHPA